ncbi:hypothetical protein GLOTRDRAFT_135767 [Gloeophyllum trabeum ATCC 11539]|uniref:Bromodomain-containing protein n=1 Tax=Gloeophyllum trabeum (strain ATCC 11539 / FP-39264 / Madison 617) TaxID=670483 RepID=S7QNZ8_GLOTA|nr:uncharacterized protein GLOTRDRAFT_135767 [Gloeophyllum trabeum ATCC 11539]EPQ61248.1 hypothetical protein GLOTRDRAFT_135767 [Gloeophyllum trabeum ATCC 11539]
MPINAASRLALEEIINVLLSATGPRGKRRLCDMFRELPDREAWPEYYDIIPQPRSMNGVQEKLKKNSYRNVMDAYEDLNLVFLNAMYYNEEGSQIWKDANTLKGMLDNEWKQRSSVLPVPRDSPPPSSAQKTHQPAAPTAVSTAPVPIAPAPTVAPPVAPPTPAPAPAPTPQVKRSASSIPSTSKPVPILPKSPPRPPSPEMEIDIGGASSDHEHVEEVARDEQSEEIVRQLEKGLPRWEGFSDEGWMAETNDDVYLDLVLAIKNHKDIVSGNRPSASLETLPEDWPIPHTPYNSPISLKLIESRCRMKSYPFSKSFDMDMEILFLKGRRWYEPGTEKYGHVCLLQRLYQALTSSSPPSGPPYASSTNFASLRAGPGTARPLHSSDTEGVPGVTTFRVSIKDRTFVDEVHYKGWSVRLADWLHMSNPDDPSKPIVAQVFKCWVSDEAAKKGTPGLTVCWYNRPEQTIHPAHRQFWEGEVFKTSHFADHPLEDIIEKIACQFTARHVRGRPRPPFWYPGWPLYVCDSRYNDRDRLFVKIKNWNSCIPDEVRKNPDFMPIYPFERTVFPRRFGSPFLKGKNVKGPGGIGESTVKGDGEKAEPGAKRPRRTGTHSIVDQTGPNKGLYVGVPGAQTSTPPGSTSQYPQHFQGQHQVQPRPQSSQNRPTEDRSIITAAGGWSNLASIAVLEKVPPETAKHFDRDPETNELLWFSGAPMNVARPSGPQYSLAYLHFLAKKRKANQAVGTDEDPNKKKKPAPKTATEIVNAVLSDVGKP